MDLRAGSVGARKYRSRLPCLCRAAAHDPHEILAVMLKYNLSHLINASGG
jgi:hypothetical protein